MSKICPKCNKEWPDEFMACPLDGTALIPKPQQPAGFNLNLGDANAISGGVNMSDNHSVSNNTVNTTTSNVDSHNVITNNITQVEREKTPEELKHEKELAFREECLKVYSNGIMTSEGKRKLDDLRYRLGLDETSANKILSEVAKRSERKSSSLSPVHQITYNNIKTAIISNRLDLVNRLLAQMKAMVQRYSAEEIQFTYYMLQAVLHPKECTEEYESHYEDKYWQTFWSSIAYRRLGNIEKSELLVADVGDKWTDTIPQENVFVLASVNALIDKDIDTAKSLFDNISGEHSQFLSNLTTSLYTQLYGDMLSSEEFKQMQKDGVFYTSNLFAEINAYNSEQMRLKEKAEANSIAEEKKKQEEVEAKALTEDEAKALYDAVDTGSDSNKINDLKKFAEASDVWAMFYYARLYHLSKGIEKNLLLAVQYYTKAAQAGNAKAMGNLGSCYMYGEGVNKDETEAVKWYKKAADLGNPVAMTNLGSCYANGRGVNNNFDEAFIWFKKAADLGNANAMYFLSNCYSNGDGITKNDDEGFRWCKKAADLGHAKAMTKLGLCYGMGTSVKENENESFNWHKKAADLGEPLSMVLLGNCYRWGKGVNQDISEAVKWYKKAADLGAEMAMNKLGDCYKNGEGVNQNSSEAVIWYTKAADAGHGEAMYNLGSCYMYGDGVNKDFAEGAKWYKKAAELGNSNAMYYLWFCYKDGTGVNPDSDKAVKWLRKAADAGHDGAMYNLGSCYMNGAGVNQDFVEGAKWYKKAAELGNAGAMINLGRCYMNGDGVNQNPVEGAKWYKQAAESEDADAMSRLGRCYMEGIGVEQDDNKGYYWFLKAADLGNTTSIASVGMCYELGKGVELSYHEALKWYQKALDNGYQMDDWITERINSCEANLNGPKAKILEIWADNLTALETDEQNTYINIRSHISVSYMKGKRVDVIAELKNESLYTPSKKHFFTPESDYKEYERFLHMFDEKDLKLQNDGIYNYDVVLSIYDNGNLLTSDNLPISVDFTHHTFKPNEVKVVKGTK